MDFARLYRIVMLGLTFIVSILFLVNYYMETVDKVYADYNPEIEIVSLTEEVSYTEDNGNSDLVFDGMTLDELANKLEKSLNSNIKGYGYKFASYALELGIDPYLALGIVLEETGCTWGCSRLVVECNNIGGMKGSGCGEYQYFSSLEAGIEGFLNNLKKNYYDYGLTTAVTMNPKYAENPLWARNVNAHMERIKSK